MNKIKAHRIDQIGIITSGLCALHCAAIPIFLSLGLLGSLSGPGHGMLETIVISISSILGVWSINNAISKNGRVIPQISIAVGALIIILGLNQNIFGHAMMAVGGFMLLYGHWLNWRHLSITNSL